MTQPRRRRAGQSRETSVLQGEDADMDNDSFIQTQTPTQVQKNLAKHSSDQVSLKVGEVVQYLLVKDQKKLPIKRADIVRNVLKEFKDIYSEVLLRAKKLLKEVFGYELVEIDVKNHTYILVNSLEHKHEDNLRVDEGTAKLGLLTIILSLIFMKGNIAKEVTVWEMLRRLRIEPGDKHPEFGDVKKLVTDEFVKQKYLEYIKIPNTEPVEYEFRWGPRAFKETSKMKILEFVSKIQHKDPKSWTSQYREAQERLPAASQASGH
uniref:MAGE domain-containing protein n=1 Tax=Leptobrachium leishanense TaxID=445787 RepID=A0A8C5PIZ5_9ANUR